VTAGTPVTAGTAVTAGPARTHARAPRAAPRRTTGTATRGERTSGEHHKRGAVRTNRRDWPVGTEHPVMVVAIGLAVLGELDAGEEDNRQHEQNACHDHHPRRGPIEAGVLGRGRVYRRGRPRRRLNRGFGCLGHVSIMPRQSPADNQLRR
jgi:hypothetical protein